MSMTQFSGSGAAVRAFQLNAGMLGGIQMETGAAYTSLLVASGTQEDGPAWDSAQSKFQLSKSFAQVSGTIIQALNYLKASISSESDVTFAEVSGALAPATSDIILGQGGQTNEVVIYGGTLGLVKDSSVLKFGTDEEITVTHAADAGLTLKNTETGDDKPFVLTIQTGETDIAADDVLGKIDFQAPDEGTGTDAILVAAGIEAVSEGDFAADNNATKLSFKTAASEAAAEKMKLSSTGVLTLNGGSGALVIPNDGNIGSAGDTDAIAISNAGVVSLSATTAASSKTTGALTVAGGVGIAADLFVGDDLALDSDAAVLSFGDDQDVTVTHVADSGLTLKNTSTGDDTPFALTIQTGEADIQADDVLGKIDFQAPDEGAGTDAILVAAGIEAVSEGDFAADSNATKLSFKTAASEAAAEKMALSSAGVLTLNGGSGALVIPNDGNIGSAGDTDAIAISNAGVVSLSATTAASSKTTGALTVAGGVGIAADLFVGDDLSLDSDAAVLSFGDDQDVTMTHVADSGLTLKNTSTGDDTPFVLTIQTGETDIAADDVLGKIDFQAPDEGAGTDAILVAAGIEAVSEGDFSAASNATKLSFKTAASEAASEKMSLSSAGNLTLANQGKIQFTDGNAFIHHDGSNGMVIQDDQLVQIAASGIQLGANTSAATVISGQATGSVGLLVSPSRMVIPGESAGVEEGAIVISASLFRHDGSTRIEVGSSAASSSLDMIPYLQIAGVDDSGNLQNYKLQVSGGMLQLNQV